MPVPGKEKEDKCFRIPWLVTVLGPRTHCDRERAILRPAVWGGLATWRDLCTLLI